MDKLKPELLYQSSPLFHAFKNSIVVFEKVERLNSKGTLQEGFLAVSVSGVFLLKYRSFPRGYVISKCIPMMDINSITVTSQNFMIKSQAFSITICHIKHVNIAAHIYYLYNMLFPEASCRLSMQLSVSPDKKELFDAQIFSYESDSLLADRFLACVLHWKCELNECILKDTFDSLSRIKDDFTITPELINNPFYKSIVQSVAFDSNLNTIIFRSISFNSIVEQFLLFLTTNSSINRIVMKKVDFTSPPHDIPSIFLYSSGTPITVSEFIFDTCDFASPDIEGFFEAFSNYPSPVKFLSFQNCSFSKETLDSLFQTIFFSSCFHSLETLQISGLNFSEELEFALSQLSGCGWVLETHCLLNLSATDCNLQLDTLIPKLLQFDSGITTIDLSGNIFTTPITTKNLKSIKSLQSFGNLVISRCHFTSETLFQLFNLIGRYDTPISIDCTSLSPSCSEMFNEFIQLIAKNNLIVKNMTGIIWDNNVLDQNSFLMFIEFLKHQPILSEISISHCLNQVNDLKKNDIVMQLQDLLHQKDVTVFEMNGDKFGPCFASLLQEISMKGKIECLTLENQELGEEALMEFIKHVPKTLSEIRFSGFDAKTPQGIINVCHLILDSHITFCQWPRKDVKTLLQHMTALQKNEFAPKFDQLKQVFISKYGEKCDQLFDEDDNPQDSNTLEISRDSNLITRFVTLNPQKNKLDHPPSTGGLKDSKISQNFEYLNSIIEYDEETRKLLEECGEINGVDPMEKIFSSVENETSFDYLLAQMSK